MPHRIYASAPHANPSPPFMHKSPLVVNAKSNSWEAYTTNNKVKYVVSAPQRSSLKTSARETEDHSVYYDGDA
ncbi:hypothetical protein ECG_02173 [Echinococcus granulosus]|nr:hypothetical protein ECG_02173 [Echinococcus granulosus]